MKNIGSILDIISDICPITGDGLVDTFLFAIIAAVAFLVAWSFTRFISDAVNYHNSKGMSGVHWIIRVIVFAVLLLIALGIVHLVGWISSWEWWVHIIVWPSLVAIVIGLIFLIKSIVKKKKAENKVNMDD